MKLLGFDNAQILYLVDYYSVRSEREREREKLALKIRVIIRGRVSVK